MLTQAQLQQLALVMQQRIAALGAELHEDAARAREESVARLGGEAGDSGERATADVIADTGNAALARDLQELRALEAAHARMAAGSYGRCVDCGGGIGFERLLAEPAALRCLPCQQRHDRTHGRAATPSL